MLARYAQQLAVQIVEVLQASNLASRQDVMGLAKALASRAEERARQVWQQRFAWAAADGRQLRQHHLAGLRYYLGVCYRAGGDLPTQAARPRDCLRAERAAEALGGQLAEWCQRLDAALPAGVWRGLERQQPLTVEQDTALRNLLAGGPALYPAHGDGTLDPPLRNLILAALGRRR